MTRLPDRGALDHRMLLGAVLLAFVLRAAFGLIYWQQKPMSHDEREYLALAANLAAGRGFTQDLPNEPAPTHVQRFGRAPIYPLFLAPIVALDGTLRSGRMPEDVPDAVKIVQAIVGAIGVWLIGSIAGAIGGARMGAVAALIASVYPPLVWICAYALSEALYATLALAAAWVLAPALDASGARSPQRRATSSPPHPPSPPDRHLQEERGGFHALMGGALVGIAILTRPAMLFFLPFALGLAWRRHPRWAALILVGAVLVILPWTVRNARVHGRFVLVASEGGITFWTGNHREARGEGDLAANPHLKQLNLDFRTRHPGLTEEQLEPIYYREALAMIAGSPIRWLGLVVKKLFYTWVPIGPSYRLHSPRYFWTSVLAYGALLPLAVAGARRLWRTGRRPWTLWALAASVCLVALVFFPQERFRIPVIDPTLIVCAAAMVPMTPIARRQS